MKAISNSGSVLLPNGHITRERGAGSLLGKKTFTTSLVARHLKMARATSRAGLMSLLALNAMVFAIIFPIYNIMGTNDAEAVAGTPIDSTITFNATRSTASVDLMVTDTNGTFASSTAADQAAFSLSTTNFTGYTLTIASNNNTSALTNTNGGSLSSISSSIDESTFNTSTYNNQWGYKPNYYGSATNSNYLPSPTTTASILDETDAANSTAKSYTIALGARADYANASGKYSSSNYKLQYVANPVAYSVTYSDNSGDSTVASLPSVQSSDSVTAKTILLTSAKPTRTGYNFKAWCLGTVSSNGTYCDGTEYASGTDFGIDRTASKASNSATLYAVWTPNKYTCTKQYRLENVDGTWGNYVTDTTEQVSFGATCTYTKAATNYRSSDTSANNTAVSTSAIMNSTNGVTVRVSLYRNVFTVTKRYRKQDTSGSYPSSYISDGSQGNVRYEASYTYSRAAETGFQAASTTVTVTSDAIVSLDVPRVQVTCNKRYRLENADGTWGSYTADGSVTAYYGGSCSYSKSVTDYRGSSTASNDTEGSASATNINDNQTLSISLYRNTFALTVSRNTTYISSASATTAAVRGTNEYRWGQVVSISATAATNSEFTSWTQSGTVGTFANVNAASTTFTMGKGASTVTAGGKSSCVNISGTMQAFTGTGNYCSDSGTLTDSRDNQTYTVRKINGTWWMTRNLAIGCNGSGDKYGSSVSSKPLTSANSHVSAAWSTPTALLTTVANNSATSGYTTAAMLCSSTYGAWYNYKAATAGTISGSSNSTDATSDICPAGWRLPTGGNGTEGTDFNILVGNVLSGWQDPTSGLSVFNGVGGGYYDGGAVSSDSATFGEWWSANQSYFTNTQRACLTHDASDGKYYGFCREDRYAGLYVRCVKA